VCGSCSREADWLPIHRLSSPALRDHCRDPLLNHLRISLLLHPSCRLLVAWHRPETRKAVLLPVVEDGQAVFVGAREGALCLRSLHKDAAHRVCDRNLASPIGN
jgi:hypothetical protein